MKTPIQAMKELIEQFENRLSSLKEVRATARGEFKFFLEVRIEELEASILSAEAMLEKQISQQREFLLDFADYSDYRNDKAQYIARYMIDDFLKTKRDE